MKKLGITPMTHTSTPWRNARRMATHVATGLVLAAALGLTGCPTKGPAEKAGEAIDRATDKVSDTVNPKGPVEKAGRAIDVQRIDQVVRQALARDSLALPSRRRAGTGGARS